MKEFVRDLSKREVFFIIVIVLLLAAAGYQAWRISRDNDKRADEINSFAECVAAGNPVMESYPEQCAAGGRTFSNPEQVAPSDDNAADESNVTDEEAIITSIVNYCTANGATDTETITAQLQTNMQDPDLFVKDGGFARLSATCGESGFRAFLRKTEDSTNAWKFIGGTQEETLNCSALDGTGIPATVAAQCYGDNAELRTIQTG